jgi:hypothetical protein
MYLHSTMHLHGLSAHEQYRKGFEAEFSSLGRRRFEVSFMRLAILKYSHW